MDHGLHHIHLRKRVHAPEKFEPFPSRTFGIRVLDHVMYGVGILSPLALLPQILQIYSTKSSAGVSLLTWLLLSFTNILWTTYALVHKDKVLLFSAGLMIFFHMAIVVGLIIY